VHRFSAADEHRSDFVQALRHVVIEPQMFDRDTDRGQRVDRPLVLAILVFQPCRRDVADRPDR
jgi:hypothetical protein